MGQIIQVSQFDSIENVRRRAAASRAQDADEYTNQQHEHPGYARGFLLLIRELWRLMRERR